MNIKATIMDKVGMDRALTRIAHEVIEKNKGTEDLYIVGIHRRGVPLAKRIAEKIGEIEGKSLKWVTLTSLFIEMTSAC